MKTIKILFIITLFLVFNKESYCQNFWEITSAPNYIKTYTMFEDEVGYIYAGAYGVGIYRSTNSGANWSLFTSGLTNLIIWSISGDRNGTIYVGTDANSTCCLFKSTNRGQSWSQISSLPPSMRINYILPISGTQTIFVGGSDGLYRSTNKGTSWAKLTNGLPSQVFSIPGIVILNNGDILAGINTINSGSKIFRSTDGGENWLPTTGETGWINKIVKDECNNYLYTLFNYGDLIWLSMDNGYSWEVRNTGIISNVTGDLVINPQHHLYVATQGGLSYQKAYKSTDYGITWNAISSGLPNVQLVSLLMTKQGYLFAGTYYNNNGYGIYKSMNATFNPPMVVTNNAINITQSSALLKGTLNPNGINVSYFFEYGLNSTYGNATAILSGGSGNTNLNLTEQLNNLQPNTTYHFRLVAEMCNGSKILGNDQEFNTLPPPSINLIAPNGGENWQVGTQKDITWASVSIANIKIEYSIDNGLYWLPVIDSTAAVTGTYIWTVPNTPSTYCRVRITDLLNSTLVDTSSNTFTISEAPSIIVGTPIAGTIWPALSQQTVTWSSTNVLGNVNIRLSTDGTTYPIILKNNTINDGTEEITVPNNQSVTCRIKVESFGNPNNIFGINDGNFTITQPVEVDETLNNQPTEYALHQNFPNPFNPTTRIYYSVPKESQVTIKLHNTLGEELTTLVDEIKSTGNYSTIFNASQLQSGVYIYRMKAGDFTAAKKMLIVK